MSMNYKLTILGSGNSDGVPAIGNFWGKCDPQEPKNRRSRASVYVQNGNTSLLIDSGPDLRTQINSEGFSKIDAVLYTHTHGDHIYGIEDLRSYAKYNKTTLDVYGIEDTMTFLQDRFDYQFEQKSKLYPAVLNGHIIPTDQLCRTMKIGDIEFIPFPQEHNTMTSLGFRFGNIAYCTDVSDFSAEALEVLKGVDVWIVDAAGYKMEKNSAHLTLEKLYAYQDVVRAKRVIMTHLTPGMDYQTLLNETPDNFEPAYDGMCFNR